MDDHGIFLISDGALIVMHQQPYESEALLQHALAQFPEVLAGGATSGDTSNALLLVKREMPVPSSETSGGTWSLDHLFLDPAGVPVVVEVKRSSDTRIRREVVGQMLDYAANAVQYWPIAQLRETLEATAQEADTTAEALVQELRPDLDPEEYWSLVEGNLSSGRIRMVFVADALPPELVRIIEFLNQQMSPAEVLGVAVPQFVGGDMQVLVPQLVGATSAAAATKAKTSGTPWNETTFLAAAEERCNAAEMEFLERLFDHEKAHGSRLNWGRGVTPGVSGWYPIAGQPTPLWTVNAGSPSDTSHAYVSVYLPYLHQKVTAEALDAFLDTLGQVTAFTSKIDEAKAVGLESKYPSISLIAFADDMHQVNQFFAALDQVIDGGSS